MDWREALTKLINEDVFGTLYRGHHDHSWALTPSLFRMLGESNDTRSVRVRLLDYFIATVVPSCESLFVEYERKLDMRGEIFKDDLFIKMSWLQHFGCPTPGLDWTNNLHAALFFALTSQRFQPGSRNVICRIYRLNRMTVSHDFLKIVPLNNLHSDSRMAKQNGYMSFCIDEMGNPSESDIDEVLIEDHMDFLDVELNEVEQHDLWTYLEANGHGFHAFFPEDFQSRLGDLCFEKFSRFYV